MNTQYHTHTQDLYPDCANKSLYSRSRQDKLAAPLYVVCTASIAAKTSSIVAKQLRKWASPLSMNYLRSK